MGEFSIKETFNIDLRPDKSVCWPVDLGIKVS